MDHHDNALLDASKRGDEDVFGDLVERWRGARARGQPRDRRGHVNTIEWESLEEWTDHFMARFGPMVTAQAMLGDRFAELRERVAEIWRRANQRARATDGSLRLPQEYLLSVVRL
jgi:hypothetical protein